MTVGSCCAICKSKSTLSVCLLHTSTFHTLFSSLALYSLLLSPPSSSFSYQQFAYRHNSRYYYCKSHIHFAIVVLAIVPIGKLPIRKEEERKRASSRRVCSRDISLILLWLTHMRLQLATASFLLSALCR